MHILVWQKSTNNATPFLCMIQQLRDNRHHTTYVGVASITYFESMLVMAFTALVYHVSRTSPVEEVVRLPLRNLAPVLDYEQTAAGLAPSRLCQTLWVKINFPWISIPYLQQGMEPAGDSYLTDRSARHGGLI